MKNKKIVLICDECRQRQGEENESRDGTYTLNTTIDLIKELAAEISATEEEIVVLVDSWNGLPNQAIKIARNVKSLIEKREYIDKLYFDLGAMINISIR